MRLRQLKISGFKSFADTTLVEFPSSLVGIVGPNGCGKSNVIDAIRWVLGEGRISELRGSNSMSELIFAGSSNRPRSARASVEMVLDNQDGSIQGPWGSYTELAIKRVVTRDGSNAYLINNQQVRRRDVQDIFMGTGLGPRSYAIISQGMISNFIKAKPEELRIYLEEAAGVSKYKERRRETETALSTTRDNLQKVAYLQETKRGEVERLEKEAETAKRWAEIDAQRRDADLLSTFMQEKDSKDSADKLSAKISEKEASIASMRTDAIELEKQIEVLKEASLAKKEALEIARQAKFEADKRVAEVEGNIRHVIERKDNINHQIEVDTETQAMRETQKAEAIKRAEDLSRGAEELERNAKNFDAEVEELREKLEVRQNAYDDAHHAYETARQESQEATNKISIVNVEMEAFDREAADVENRLATLKEELEGKDAPDENRLKELASLIAQAEEKLKTAQDSADTKVKERDQAQAELFSVRDKKEATGQELARLSARLQTLQSLQEKAGLEGKLPAWLTKMGLTGVKRFFERVEVDPEWARALQALLTTKAAALPIGKLESVEGFSLDAPPSRLTFYGGKGVESSLKNTTGLKPLFAHVKGSDEASNNALSTWLSDVFAAETLKDAMAVRSNLAPSQRIVTKKGHIVDAVSVSFWAEDFADSGLLTRASEIKALTKKEVETRDELNSLEEKEREVKARFTELEVQTRAGGDELIALRENAHNLQVEETRLTAEVSAWNARHAEISSQIEDLKSHGEELNVKREEIESKFEALDATLALKQQAVTDAQLLLEEAETYVSETEEGVAEKLSAAKMARFQAQSNRERALDATRESEVAEGEIKRLGEEIEALKAELAELNVQAERDGLAEVTQALDVARAALLDAEEASNVAENAIEETRAKREELNEAQKPLADEVTEWKIKREQFVTVGSAFTAHLDELNADRAQLSQRVLNENLKLGALKSKVKSLTEEMAALGPVNHAALENLETVRKVMQETELQVRDLQEAIANLEATIQKIDAETRELLHNTFDEVNKNFGEMFTSLFGGGSGELRMLGEEILDTGIEVFAQPPGKRNTSVKLLSGGEQALTATALVFAIFKLNPAPFCLLDEVDAPLDEANQDRLATRIQQMSDKTQFMMITHHRVTMEHLQQLIGVTMKEPGVSRVVAVDIAEATRIAEA